MTESKITGCVYLFQQKTTSWSESCSGSLSGVWGYSERGELSFDKVALLQEIDRSLFETLSYTQTVPFDEKIWVWQASE